MNFLRHFYGMWGMTDTQTRNYHKIMLFRWWNLFDDMCGIGLRQIDILTSNLLPQLRVSRSCLRKKISTAFWFWVNRRHGTDRRTGAMLNASSREREDRITSVYILSLCRTQAYINIILETLPQFVGETYDEEAWRDCLMMIARHLTQS